MWQAISKAAKMTRPDGLFAFALYERSPLCGFWRIEKRIYKDLPSAAQKVVRAGFIAAYAAALLLKGRDPVRRFRTQSDREMETTHDVHDQLGGYPYESHPCPRSKGSWANVISNSCANLRGPCLHSVFSDAVAASTPTSGARPERRQPNHAQPKAC